MANKKLLQIELNEFDPEFLREQSEILELKNIKKFLDFPHSQTITNDEIEHQGLDPWVQWVNVHSGVPSVKHGIKRLGDTKNQKELQIWEAVAASGKKWAVWGVMNAPMGNKDGGEVFMPDPWSFNEVAYPDRLNYLLSLPRYMARNYLEINSVEFTKKFMNFVRYYVPPQQWSTLLRFLNETIKASFTVGISLHSLTTLLDYLGTLEFLRYRKKKSPDFSVIFLNHIAHLQHQFWTQDKTLHPEMKFGLQVNNLIMGLLLDSCAENEAVIILNGLKQKNVSGKGFYVYRQINPKRTFVKLLANQNIDIEQCMTNDAHLKFETENDAKLAFAKLDNMCLSDNTSLFFVDMVGPKHIFVQLSIEHHVGEDTFIVSEDESHKFYDLFNLICERTGAHVSVGDVFAKRFKLPKCIYNHEIYHEVLNYFNKPQIKEANNFVSELC